MTSHGRSTLRVIIVMSAALASFVLVAALGSRASAQAPAAKEREAKAKAQDAAIQAAAAAHAKEVQAAKEEAAKKAAAKAQAEQEAEAKAAVARAAAAAKGEPVALDLTKYLVIKPSQFKKIKQYPWAVTPLGKQTFAGVPLESLPRLSRLILNGSAISDAGLQTLAGLPLADSLISLGLRGTKVTDEGMTVIEKFSHLQRLDVSQTALTDDGLVSLQGLPLEVLNVADTKISEAGVKPLQEKLPELVVKR